MDVRVSWMTLGAAALLCAGCRNSAPEEIVDLSPRPQSLGFEESPSFVEAVKAGESALEAVPSELRLHSTFGPAQKRKIIASLAPAEVRLARSLSGVWTRRFEPYPLDEIPSSVQGWNWLARSLDWQSQEALNQQNWPLAAQKSMTAIQFGLRWSSGDCFDAVGGFAVAEAHALRIAPAIPQMGPRTLEAFSSGVQAGLKSLANPEVTLANEQNRLALTMQQLQTACRKDGYDGMRPIIGPSSHDGAAWVRNNKSRLGWFFRSFLEECQRLSGEYVDYSLGAKPFDPDIYDQGAERWEGILRPWKDMTPHAMAGHEAYRKARLSVVSRLRLLAASSAIEARLKKEGSVPKDLSFLSESIRKDPYGSGDLAYRPGTVTYRIWSVGPNGVDDGGLVDPGAVVLDMGLTSPVTE